MWTDEPGVVLAVLIADCVPVLLVDPAARRIATVHAGWRGMTSGVIEATVRAMGGAPDALMASIGPSTGPCCYEAGDDAAEAARAALGPAGERRKGAARGEP